MGPHIKNKRSPSQSEKNETRKKFRHIRCNNKKPNNNDKARKSEVKEIKTKKLKIFHCNARGAKGKIVSIETAVKALNAHVITISETKGKPPPNKYKRKEPRKGR